jgi:hypothetical protein
MLWDEDLARENSGTSLSETTGRSSNTTYITPSIKSQQEPAVGTELLWNFCRTGQHEIPKTRKTGEQPEEERDWRRIDCQIGMTADRALSEGRSHASADRRGCAICPPRRAHSPVGISPEGCWPPPRATQVFLGEVRDTSRPQTETHGARAALSEAGRCSGSGGRGARGGTKHGPEDAISSPSRPATPCRSGLGTGYRGLRYG